MCSVTTALDYFLMPFEGDGNREVSIEVATFEQNLVGTLSVGWYRVTSTWREEHVQKRRYRVESCVQEGQLLQIGWGRAPS